MPKNRYPILWILVLAAALRFIQVDAPPVGRHAWRQCDTASVARNFHHNGYRLLHPQIDWEIPGFVEMEFPIYPWVTSLLYGVTGESVSIARVLAILGALITIGFLYLIVARTLGRQAALWSAFFYSILPLNLFFGRAIMPESWMLAATALGVYFFIRWVEDDSGVFYLLALLGTALACLLKLTSLYLGLPLLWLAWQKWGRSTLLRWQVWLFAGVVASVLVLWYGHAYQLGQEYGASFHILTAAGADKWGTWNLLLEPEFYHQVFVGNLGGRMLTWAGFPVFLVGLSLHRRSSREYLIDVWLTAVTVMLLVVSFGAYQHDYYSLPIVLPAVAYMGKAFARGWQNRKSLLAVVAMLVLLLSGYRHLGTLSDERHPGLDSRIAETLASATDPSDLVISCNSANPVWLYLSGRRGWGRDCESLDRSDLHDLIRAGARYLVAPAAAPLRAVKSSPFFDIVKRSDEVIVAQAFPPPTLESLVWHSSRLEDFTGAAAFDQWTYNGGKWEVRESSLVGTRERGSAAARSIFASPECQSCSTRLTVTLLPPTDMPDSDESAARQRGTGRPHSRASIDLGWREEGMGMSLDLSTRSGEIRLRQFEKGSRVGSTQIDYALLEGRSYELELQSNGLEIQLLVGGQTVLRTDYRLTSPYSGRVELRPRIGSLQLDRLEILRGTESVDPDQDLQKP